MEAFRYLMAVCIVTAWWGCDAVNTANHIELDEGEIEQTVSLVIKWQFENHKPENWNRSWEDATLFTGVVEAAAAFGDESYWAKARAWGERNRWKLGAREFHADDQAVGQVYLELYEHYGERMMIQDFRRSVDGLLEKTVRGRELWWWCDALFMAPPGIARLSAFTEHDHYLQFLNQTFWDAKAHLYDENHHLFFRDSTFFNKHDSMGNPVFWARGNGWVIAGMVRIMQSLPETNPFYQDYRHLFIEMMDRIVQLQSEDGLWRTNLLSPEIYPGPETSGSAFFCYGLGWGINQEILEDHKYRNAFQKAWNGLQENIGEDGKVNAAQEPGIGPAPVEQTNSEIYATGAFLMAASEAYKVAVSESK